MSNVDNFTTLLRLVSSAYDIPEELIRGKGRSKFLIEPRIIFIYYCREAGYSFPEIGRFLNRDHSTIINYISEENENRYNRFKEKIYNRQDEEGYEQFLRNRTQGKAKPTKKTQRFSKYKSLFAQYAYRCAVPNCNFDSVLEIHHILPRAKGGTDDLSNLIVLCPNHHSLADKGFLYIKDILE